MNGMASPAGAPAPQPSASRTLPVDKTIWQQYRQFRCSVVALEALEMQLGATLLQFTEDSRAERLNHFEIAFLTQSLQILQETSEQALNSIRAIESGTVAPLLDDGAAFVASLQRRIPDLSEETRAGVMLFLQRYGSPRKWVGLVGEILSAKRDFYRSAQSAVPRTGNTTRAFVLRNMEEMMLRHHAMLPEFPPAGGPHSPTSQQELPTLIEQAIERGQNRLNNGAPGFLAGAWYHRLANEIAWRDPEQAAAFGIFVAPKKPQALVACLLSGGPGVAICIIAALIAISSHDFEPDGVPDDGGGGGGGTTGEDDGPWGGDGDADPPDRG